MISPATVEQIRQWGTTIGVVTGLGLIVRLYLGKRHADVTDRRARSEAETEIRDDAIQELRNLREEVRLLRKSHREEIEDIKDGHRKDVEAFDARHRKCEEEREQLREKLTALRAYADGLYRIILQNSAAGVLSLGDLSASDDVKRAAEAVDALFKRDLADGNPSR